MWHLQHAAKVTALEFQSSVPHCLVDTGARKRPGGGEERKDAQEQDHGFWITSVVPLTSPPCPPSPQKRDCPELPRVGLVPDAAAVLRWRDRWQQ